MISKKNRLLNLKATTQTMNEAIDAHRPWWPIILASFIAVACLALLLLPFTSCILKSNHETVYQFSFFKLMVGHINQYSRFNIWYTVDFAAFVLAFIFPFFGGKRQAKWAYGVSDALLVFALCVFCILPTDRILDYSFTNNIFLISPSPVGPFNCLGFYIPLALNICFLGLFWAARAISGHLAKKEFFRSVKTGKKLLNY